MIFRLLWFLKLWLLGCFAQAQSDSIRIQDVLIVDKSLRETSRSLSTKQWSSRDIAESQSTDLANFLEQGHASYLKNYGPGMLSTLSIRGASSSQSSILWNGVPIQSPMLGLLDVSLLPAQSFQDIQLNPASDASMRGSGHIGGALHLNNRANTKNTAKIHSQYGSFGNLKMHGQLQYRMGKLQLSSSYNHCHMNNRYPYRIADRIKIMEQAFVRKQQFMQHAYMNIDKHSKLAAHYWFLNSHKGIPPTSTQTKSTNALKDKAHRAQLHYKRGFGAHLLSTSLSYANEQNIYLEQKKEITNNRFRTLQFISSFDYRINKQHSLYLGLSNSHTTAFTPAYGKPIHYIHHYLNFAYHFKQGIWNSQFGIRKGLSNQGTIPWIPNIKIGVEAAGQSIELQVQRSYRLPSMNDLYWQPGGNPELLPEQGWSVSGSWQTLNYQSNTWKTKLLLSLYNRDIKHWILWSRPAGKNFFKAYNAAAVRSTGLELSPFVQFQKSQWKLSLQAAYHYVSAIHKIGLSLPRIKRGEQLWYTPKHTARLQLGLQYLAHRMHYYYRYVGATLGINDSVPSFQLHGIQYAYSSKLYKSKLQFKFSIHNLLNLSYRIIERRPMPGRHVVFGIHFII